MVISRKEAITLSSFVKMISLSEKELADVVEDALAEREYTVKGEEDKNKLARKYIEYSFSTYTNAYLQLFLSQSLNKAFEVKGKRQKLVSCECCGYKTLSYPGGWDICNVCFWEDDGSARDESKVSASNHITLAEAKKNFLKFGASKESSLSFLDKDRFLQFATNINTPEKP